MINLRLIPLVCLGLLLLGGCAHKSPNSAAANDEPVTTEEIEHFRVNETSSSPNQTQVEELEIIPTEVNEHVDKWVHYFQNRGRPHMEKYLLRSTRYEALMKKVLRDNKLPEDLFYIALIESGFSSQAFSRASAVGYWQFIRGTGKRYKLKINQLIDERRDPVMSTQAAADYFKDLYQRFNSWYLAMAAYNVGEGRIDRVIKKYKTRDFWALTRIKKAFPSETDNYVPKFIAAKLIAKNPDKYGFDGIDYMPPIEFDHVNLNQPVNLRIMAEKMNINYEDFKALNPKFKGEIAPLDDDKALGLRIPPGSYEQALAAATDSKVDEVVYIADKDEIQTYKVRPGDTISTIARKFRTNVAYIRDINNFPRKKTIRAGQKIFVPDRTPLNLRSKSTVVAKEATKTVKAVKKTTQKKNNSKVNFHVVRKGDNISTIAKKYNTSIDVLRKLNRSLSSKSLLKVGMRVRVPEDNIKL